MIRNLILFLPNNLLVSAKIFKEKGLAPIIGRWLRFSSISQFIKAFVMNCASCAWGLLSGYLSFRSCDMVIRFLFWGPYTYTFFLLRPIDFLVLALFHVSIFMLRKCSCIKELVLALDSVFKIQRTFIWVMDSVAINFVETLLHEDVNSFSIISKHIIQRIGLLRNLWILFRNFFNCQSGISVFFVGYQSSKHLSNTFKESWIVLLVLLLFLFDFFLFYH